MSMSNENVGHGAQSGGRLGSAARDAGDFVRRALTVAAREEANQVRQEAMERLAPATQSSGMMLGGVVLGAYGTGYLLQALVRALSIRMPPWSASLLVGLLLVLGGMGLAEAGRRRLKAAASTADETTGAA